MTLVERWKALVKGITAVVSTLVLVSCTTLASTTSIEASDFPIFPDPIEGETPIVTLEGDIVTMPLWYWQAIARYAIEVDKIRQIVEATSECK